MTINYTIILKQVPNNGKAYLFIDPCGSLQTSLKPARHCSRNLMRTFNSKHEEYYKPKKRPALTRGLFFALVDKASGL